MPKKLNALLEELKNLEMHYERVSKDLTNYRKEYYKLYEIYADDPDILVPKIQKLSALLDYTKVEALDIYNKIEQLRKDISYLRDMRRKRWSGRFRFSRIASLIFG